MWILKLISRLPFPALYFFSDVLFVVAYHVAGYRKKVVFDNLKNSFPEKSEAEIRKVARGFYRNLADVIVETIKGYSISRTELKKRVKMKNPELLDRNFDMGRSCIAMLPHLCNWEWIGLACSIYLRLEIDVVYQRLVNKTANSFMWGVRTHFGAVPIEKKMVFRDLVKRKDVVKAIGMLADQSPARGENRYWTTFMNQDTAFFAGSEKIARRFGYPVYFIAMRRVKRGFYEMEFHTIAEPPFEQPEGWIMETFAKKAEEVIRNNPSDYLWSHKRWKLSKPETA